MLLIQIFLINKRRKQIHRNNLFINSDCFGVFV